MQMKKNSIEEVKKKKTVQNPCEYLMLMMLKQKTSKQK